MGIGGIYFSCKMIAPKDISINDYAYDLPERNIAYHPLLERDASKLLIYKNGEITPSTFLHIAQHLPENSLLVFNDTKVINARIKFTKNTGSTIEIFCLEPFGLLQEYSTIMSTKTCVQWKCFVGGAAKWKEPIIEKKITIESETVLLSARIIEKITEAYIIEFNWLPTHFSFAEIIEAAGDVPLPPYIKRVTDDEDNSRYQTVYATHDGSVAAPTAGLHFNEKIFKTLSPKNIQKAFVTLHVGAGTFKPVKADTMQTHEMHAEYIDVHYDTIEFLKNNTKNIAAVGTTSLRTLETLYWLGVKVSLNKNIQELSLLQWDVYENLLSTSLITSKEALENLLDWMKENDKKHVFTKTQLLIAPGYTFKMVKMLVTNFHQPKSTLLLLVAAAIGNDWRKMYGYALKNNFRFLSYGDGNLIFL
jgi:S-adenosylmethionine:tRNA ribosyltransferase-isomerase